MKNLVNIAAIGTERGYAEGYSFTGLLPCHLLK